MNYIWGAIILISVLCAIATGRVSELSSSILKGASDSINLVISMMGMMCLWSGLIKIADSGGLTQILAKLFSPIMRKLFPEYDAESPAIKAICMNITANLLGLGNAATPMGILAMQEMAKSNKLGQSANNSMVMFVVINTASLQIIPTLMSTLRQSHGSTSPFDVLPAIWTTSIISLLVGIIAAKILEKRSAYNG